VVLIQLVKVSTPSTLATVVAEDSGLADIVISRISRKKRRTSTVQSTAARNSEYNWMV
jgi:hypothetical protein